MKDCRKKIIKIRVSESEYELLKSRSLKPRLAEWIREYCLGARIPAKRYVNVDPDLIRQLAGLGNNLNQIARAINSQDWKPVDRVQVITALASIQRSMDWIRMENTQHDR